MADKRVKLNVNNIVRGENFVEYRGANNWLIVFNIPSTARTFRDGAPISCPLQRT